MVAVNQSPEIQLMMESMADDQVLAKSSAYSSKQQRVRQLTPPTIKNKTTSTFDYDYSQKIDNGLNASFSINTACAISPWAEERHIMRIGLKGFIPDLNNITGRCVQGLKGNITVS
jgi:hypothetical protein